MIKELITKKNVFYALFFLWAWDLCDFIDIGLPHPYEAGWNNNSEKHPFWDFSF